MIDNYIIFIIHRCESDGDRIIIEVNFKDEIGDLASSAGISES